jgi:TPP-dependent pyruvate/acetoin dehydrogenase alpha subunit
MQVSETEWSTAEKQIAHDAFEKAYQRETSTLIEVVRQRASGISELDDMWQLHDFLSARRHELDGKYDYRDSVLIFVFAGLVKEGWLSLDDLHGLKADKLAKISALTRM